MVYFNGSMKLKLCEAVELRPTDFSTRFVSMGPSKTPPILDPYINIDIDEVFMARSTTKAKTTKPVWNEDFTSEVHNGQNVNLTVFHDSTIPPDEFVAICTLSFEDLKDKADLWVCMLCLGVYLVSFGERTDRTLSRFRFTETYLWMPV